MAEKLNEQVMLSMEDAQTEQGTAEPKENHEEEQSENINGAKAERSSPTSEPPSFSSLLPLALSAVLQSRPPSGAESDPEQRSATEAAPRRLERLQTELRELRSQFEQMKTQHNKEIKLLMNELDEEKRIRLTLQMEIQRMKKHMSK
ncbi:SH3 domain-containing kinase-binding protein 1 [Synchiropus splendidus]|uniref:SH3 domain-containing kinase-binding protein 1 n=1 Tax=Synchiropus splendidus TaxID=270530 RepID=UPI00237DA4CD|nr:SH3 domain-containing kinase-binding protein 1 [Synchiropus splendidus]